MLSKKNKKLLMDDNGYFTGSKLLTYNPIITQIISNRTFGKTWTFKKRAFKRGLKYGKKTLWLRTFKDDAKEAADKMYDSLDLQKFCGIVPYDKETKQGNFMRVGSTFYVKRRGKWTWFLMVKPLSKVNSLRGVDDINLDTIVYDECLTTPERLTRYRGNVVDDLLDIFYSCKREHKMRIIMLGNKEIANNPFLSYFGINQVPTSFEGIKMFRNGTFMYVQVNNKQRKLSAYDDQLEHLFIGTNYGKYLYGDVKNATGIKFKKPPNNAGLYIQMNWNGVEFQVLELNGDFYFKPKIELTRPVYCNVTKHCYKTSLTLVKKQKRYFIALINAVADNRVHYANASLYEVAQQFYKWLGL